MCVNDNDTIFNLKFKLLHERVSELQIYTKKGSFDIRSLIDHKVKSTRFC